MIDLCAKQKDSFSKVKMSEVERFYEWLEELQPENGSDTVIAIIHWILTQMSGFPCLGTGHEGISQDGEEQNDSHALPIGWNTNREGYTLRYMDGGKVFVLVIAAVDDVVILNVMSGEPLQSLNSIIIKINDVVTAMGGDFRDRVPNAAALLDGLNAKLLRPVSTRDRIRAYIYDNNAKICCLVIIFALVGYGFLQLNRFL